MSVVRPSPATAGLTTEQVISNGARQLGVTEHEFVDDAVRTYLETYRAQQTVRMREVMSRLDGSDRARVALLAGLSPDRVDELGGTGE
jgi:hypothetical protein